MENKLKRYRFAQINGFWFLMVKPNETEVIYEFSEITNEKVISLVMEEALNGSFAPTLSEKNILATINIYARQHECSVLEAVGIFQRNMVMPKVKYLLQGKTLLINENGGFNFLKEYPEK